MRKKTIAAIFSVYFVICAAYGISRSVMQSSDTQSVQVTEQAAVQTSAQTTNSAQTSASAPSTENSGAQTTTKSSQQTTVEKDDDDNEQDAAVTSQSETTITQQTQPDVPSLDEYLSKLRCGGCRRNCSLASPRCMNGRRKASSAESEYYSLYG